MSKVKLNPTDVSPLDSEEQPDRRAEASAIIKELIALGVLAPDGVQLIQFSDAEVLLMPEMEANKRLS